MARICIYVFCTVYVSNFCFAVDLLKIAGLRDGTQMLVAGPSGQKDAYLILNSVSTVLTEQEWAALDSNFSMRLLLNISVNTAVTISGMTTIVSVGNFSVSLTKTNLVINLHGEAYTVPVSFAAGFQNISIDLEPGYMLVYVNCFEWNVTISSSIATLFEPGATGNLTIADPSPLIVGTQLV